MAHATNSDLDEFGVETDELTENFVNAADHLKSLVGKLDDNTLLNLYGYYKQGTEGFCNISKPSWYNTKGRAKWEAWNKLGNMPQNEAKSLYIKLLESIDPSFRTSNIKGWVCISTLQSHDVKLNESEKSLTDFIKEGNHAKVVDILKSFDQTKLKGLINKLDDDGLGFIHWAADRGILETLQALISYGADVNLVDTDMQTALHYAASCGHVDCIMELLKNKANVNLKDADGFDPKTIACDESIKELFNCKQ